MPDRVRETGKKETIDLIGFLDDGSRLIMHPEILPDKTARSTRKALQLALRICDGGS
jgi:hypothetical protein